MSQLDTNTLDFRQISQQFYIIKYVLSEILLIAVVLKAAP